MKNYDIAFKSEKGSKKESYEQNGDYCAWLETDHWVVATLADGVGSYANDYEASETSCKMFLEKCRQHLLESLSLDEKTMCSFCEEIDPILAKKKEMSCFSAVAWRTDEERAIWLNIGDTRIYKYSFQSGFKQITVDDHGKAVVRRVNGKVHTDHGSVVTAIPISRAIGDTKLEFHTGTLEFLPGESLILCCDGMYDSATFEKDTEHVLGSYDLTDATSKIPHTNDDDASILLLRRTDGYEQTWTAKSLMEKINAWGYLTARTPLAPLETHYPIRKDADCSGSGPTAGQNSVPRNILLREVGKFLTNGISTEGEEKTLTALIKLCREKRLFLSYKKTSEILNSAKERYRALAPDDPNKTAIEQMVIQLQYYTADTPK